MDLYRFFHPHHNPRLRLKALRLQEISELEIATKELFLALKRAALRMDSIGDSATNTLIDSAKDSIELAHEFLKNLVEIYPEDSSQDLKNLLEERKTAPGWEAWTKLLSERIKTYQTLCFSPLDPPTEEAQEIASDLTSPKLKASA